jgi:uncharacterized damage-inducible protein DinB
MENTSVYPTLESRSDILKMLDDATWARRQILEQCATLSSSRLTDPVYPGTWSVLQNLAHLAWAEAFMLAWINTRPGVLAKEDRPPEPELDLAAIRTALDEAHAAVIAFVKANPDAVLREPCQYGNRGQQTVGGVLFHLIEHEIHHRGFILHKLAKLSQIKDFH